jgi:hypothetical protein
MHSPRDSGGLFVFTGRCRLLRGNCPEVSGNLPRSAGITTNWTLGEIQAIFVCSNNASQAHQVFRIPSLILHLMQFVVATMSWEVPT